MAGMVFLAKMWKFLDMEWVMPAIYNTIVL